jgi:radical SAM superfamily enzyme YgiQ (UPF0313 family)
MNYLLVMPKKLSTGATTTNVIFPLGIAYVSAAMKQAGYRVFTANLDFPEGDTYSTLRQTLLTNHIDVVCTGGLSLDCHKIIEVIDIARQVNPGILTVVGGGIISSDPDTAMRVLGADIGVIGEGERTMCELANALDNGQTYRDIPGLIFRNGAGGFFTTAPRDEISDLDSIPFPDFDGFNYEQWVNFYGGSGVLISDRSCPFHCTFCFHPTGEKYRQRSLDNIFQEIDCQTQRYHVIALGLTSELFATNTHRVLEFCDRIERYHIVWSCCLRVTDVNADLLRRMRASGCRLICFGLESADKSVLKSMRKGITVEQIERALDLVSEAGISTEFSNFIFGDINETRDTVANTLKVWWKYNKKTHINLSFIQTFPGTYLYKYACENGIITDKEQFLRDGCPIINVSKLSNTEFHDLTSLITELRLHPHMPAESLQVVQIEPNGDCKLEYVCHRCGTVNSADVWFWFTKTCNCSSCGVKNEVDAFRAAHYREDAFLSELPADTAVALRGAGGIYYKLVNQYPSLASERFLLIDANPEIQGLSIRRKPVHPPDIITRNSIKVVIVTALSRKDDIGTTLCSSYPSVKTILIPSFKNTVDGIVPVLQPYCPTDLARNAYQIFAGHAQELSHN